MHIPTHFLSSWALANAPKFTTKERFFCLLVGTLPDIDGIGIVVSQEAYERYHHVVGHNFLAGVALSGGLALASQRKWFAFFFYLVVFHFHIFLDLLGSGIGWTVSYLWPFSSRRFEWETVAWQFGGWENKVAFLITVAAMIWIAKKFHRTFFEYWFPEGDKILLRWMRIRGNGLDED